MYDTGSSVRQICVEGNLNGFRVSRWKPKLGGVEFMVLIVVFIVTYLLNHSLFLEHMCQYGNKYKCTIDQELTGAAAYVRSRCFVISH